MQALRNGRRICAWAAIPAALIVVRFFGGPETGDSPLLMAGGLAGLSGLTLMSERWRRPHDASREKDASLPRVASEPRPR